jgi:hypothetical protein
MIELRVKTEVRSVIKEPNPTAPILQYLAERLDKENFFGKIILTFENGVLRNTKIEQSFTTPELANTVIH